MHNTYYLMSDVCYFMNNNEESGYSYKGKKKTADPCLTPCTKQLQKGWRPGGEGRTQRGRTASNKGWGVNDCVKITSFSGRNTIDNMKYHYLTLNY